MEGESNHSPKLLSDLVYKWLDSALDYGISEQDFWNMTISELERAFASKRRMRKYEAQERASYDYILADLIGRSVARVYNSNNKLPDIHEVYPTLFEQQKIEDERAAKRDELSALRFKQFAQSFNKRFTGGAKKDE